MKNGALKSILLVSFFLLIGCAESAKKKEQNDVVKENDSVEKNAEETRPKDVFELIADSFSESKEVNKYLGRLLYIKKVSIIEDPESDKNIYIAFLLDEETASVDLTNYKFILRMFPHKEDTDLLREDAKARNRIYDSWYFKPKMKQTGALSFLYKTIDTPISGFRQIYIQLYDLNEKKIVEETLVVRNLELQ